MRTSPRSRIPYRRRSASCDALHARHQRHFRSREESQGKAARRIARVGEDNICTSIIVAAELRYGCAKSGSKRLLEAVENILSEIDVLPFDIPGDAEYGAIRSGLETIGKPIGGNDLLIAAHASAI